MGSPITFSGFNNIDFSVVLNAVMQQESQPLTALQNQQQDLRTTDNNYGTLATKLDALGSAAKELSTASTLSLYSATSSDSSSLSVAATTGAVPGRYEVVVNELARAQATATTSTAADFDTTTVATGGSLVIGGKTVNLSGSATLQQLATAINDTTDIGVTATIVQSAPGAYRLLLTAKDTGAANSFTIVNSLTGSTVAFADTDHNGESGDSALDNTVQATDASVLINNLTVTSSTNTLTSGIPGVTLTLDQKDPAKTVVVTVAGDQTELVGRLKQFVTSYNDLAKFADDQAAAARNGSTGTLGRDSVLQSLRSALRSSLTATYGSGTYTSLAQMGVSFTRTGQLALDETALSTALAADPGSVSALVGVGSAGAFGAIDDLVTAYTQAGGFVPSARTQVSDQLSRLSDQISNMQARLAIRKAALQQEFSAADQAMSRLNSQTGSLSSFSSSLKTNA